ncbi:MAG: molybdopterin molybdotransferase MoeA [Candidatus Accumulibacter sp.]|jgi:molybdopterin molybdotransferase|nr:molybdopterin molybdotransferase MoeA [Accumulibacter sp.]
MNDKLNNLSVGEAQACVLRYVPPGGSEAVPLEQSLGRVLTEDVRANRDLPPCDVSAMDGFAVRSNDLVGDDTVLTVIGDIKAGDRPRQAIASGQCARIMTGAPLPPGADAIVRVEDTQALSGARIGIAAPVKAGKDIRVQGEVMQNGETALAAGTEITPGAVGVLASLKRARVSVRRRPRVAILSSGDELEALDAPFDPERIPESNAYALMAQTQALGIEPVYLGIARDDPEELAGCLRQGLAHDVLLVSGGSSVGAHDHVRPTLEALGVTLHFWGVEMKPGHPVAFGTRDQHLVFALPGNPVSSMVCFEQFVLPALRAFMGHARLFRRTVTATLTQAVKHRPGRAEFVRVTLQRDANGRLTAASAGGQGSDNLCSMARADGLLILPEHCAGLAAGATARVQLFDGAGFEVASGFMEKMEETP